ncbi:MAG TPA: DNA alkylation response protein, partial [Chiayiivirga sp.]|nr:DNA alkylation response protein [Chiayiivirga sp.]HRO88072.1 DNA alkylation response protein [Chiayiivirga sp.]
SIWEGSGNIQCLDVLRALRREPATREALMAELAGVAGENRRLDDEARWIERTLDATDTLEARARLLTERIALALEATQLIRAGQAQAADLFIATRLDGQHGQCFGTLPADAPFDALIGRAFPES